MKYRPEEVKRKMDSMKKETVMCGKEDGDGVWGVGWGRRGSMSK